MFKKPSKTQWSNTILTVIKLPVVDVGHFNCHIMNADNAHNACYT